MPLKECPGPDRKKPAVPEEVECPECGAEIEMWTNETQATCPSCGEVVSRDRPDPDK